MKILKLLSLALLSALAFNAYGMEEGIVQEENDSPVPSLRNLCITRTVKLIKQDPEFCEREGQPQLTKDAKKQVAVTLMKNHLVIPFITNRLKIASPKEFSGKNGSLAHTNLRVFTTDNTQILTASDADSMLLDTITANCLSTIEKSSKLDSVVVSFNGKQILTTSLEDNTAKLWDKETATCICSFTGHADQVTSAVFSPDDSEILTASDDRTVKLWNTNTGACIKTFPAGDPHHGVESAIFSHDGLCILTTSYKNVRLWNKKTGSCIQTFTGHTKSVSSEVFSPDDSQILTASTKSMVRLWDKGTGNCIRRFFQGHIGCWFSRATFSPDGSQIIAAYFCHDGYRVKLWDKETGTCIYTFYFSPGTGIIEAETFNQIITTQVWERAFFGKRGTVRRYDITNIRELYSLLTKKLSIQQAVLLDKIYQSRTGSEKLILDIGSTKIFSSLDPEIQKVLAQYVIKQSSAVTAPCPIV